MGYFSRKALDIIERSRTRPDRSYPSEENILQFRLEELMDKLDELEAIRPHDPMHPLYDRYMYEDYISSCYEEPHTVQGILRAIDEVKILMERQKDELLKHQRFLSSIRDTGADPDGQIVIISIFLPVPQHAVFV